MRQSNSSAIQPEVTSFGANRGKMGGGGHVQEDILIKRKKDVVLVQAAFKVNSWDTRWPTNWRTSGLQVRSRALAISLCVFLDKTTFL